MKMNKIVIVLIMSFTFALGGCVKDEYGNERPMTDAEKGALIGAVLGAGVGLTQKKKHGNKAVLIGAVGGAVGGGAVGYYMDSQKKDLEKALKPEMDKGVIRIQKLDKNRLLLSMTAETAFDVNATTIKTGFHYSLNKLAKILNKYGKTELLIIGHTDSTGSAQYNQGLSIRRAQAVEQYLLARKVVTQRLSSYGKGESQPVASNATAAGRRLNRRVDILVVPIVAN